MRKRGNGEGTIGQRKDGTFFARHWVETSAGPKRETIYGKKGETRVEVAKKLAKAIADRDRGLAFDAGKQTVGDYLERWLSGSVRDTVRQRTYERYESIVRVRTSAG